MSEHGVLSSSGGTNEDEIIFDQTITEINYLLLLVIEVNCKLLSTSGKYLPSMHAEPNIAQTCLLL